MAYTITTAVNIDSLTGKQGLDGYNINGGALTIDSDSRYSYNAAEATGPTGNITISNSLGGSLIIDGSQVRLIPFTYSGAANVPARNGSNTSVQQGAVAAQFLGIWSNLTTYVAAGSAIPASGFLKVKYVSPSPGSFAAGNITLSNGAVITATGADVPGWMEVVGAAGAYISLAAKGVQTFTGVWFQLSTVYGNTSNNGSGYNGLTSGVAGQTFQLPATIDNTYWPGIQVETSVGSGVYEWYPNIQGAQNPAATVGTEVARGKICYINNRGLVTLGYNGSVNSGYTPVAGLNIRVPNACLQTSQQISRNLNQVADYVSGSMYSTNFTNATVNWSIIACNWVMNGGSSPYSFTWSNVNLDFGFYIAGCAQPVTLSDVCIGQNCYTTNNSWQGFVLTNINGVTLTNVTVVGASPMSNFVSFTSVSNLTTTNFTIYSGKTQGGGTSHTMLHTNGTNITHTNLKVIGGCPAYVTVSNLTHIDEIYIDCLSGTTGSPTSPNTAISLTTCSNVLFSGLSLPVTNCQPKDELVYAITGCNNITIRNIGTPAAPLSMGSVNNTGVIFNNGGSTTYNNTITIQRVYVNNLRQALISATTDYNVVMQNVWDTAAARLIIGNAGQLCYRKGCYASATLSLPSSPFYGTHFYDCYTGATTGVAGILAVLPKTQTVNALTYSWHTTSGFTGSGSGGGYMYLCTIGDWTTWTWDYYMLGYTGFTVAAPTLAGPGYQYFLYEYQLDKNDTHGFGADVAGSWTASTWANLMVGNGIVLATVTNNSPTITITTNTYSVTPKVGDYIFGTGVATGNRIQAINGNTITCTLNNTATNTGVSLTFCHLPAETPPGSMAANGFKLMIRITCLATGTSNYLSELQVPLITDAVSQTVQYPLSNVTVTLNNVVVGSRWMVETPAGIVLGSGTAASSTVSFTTPYNADQAVIVRVRKSSTAPKYLAYELNATITAIGLIVPVAQVIDTIAV